VLVDQGSLTGRGRLRADGFFRHPLDEADANHAFRATGSTNFTRTGASLFMNYIVPDKLVIRGSIGVARLEGESSSRGPRLITDSNISYYAGARRARPQARARLLRDLRTGPELRRRRDVDCLGLDGLQVHAVAERPDRQGCRENKFTGEGGGQTGGKDTILWSQQTLGMFTPDTQSLHANSV
jgi:hypothetical protein